MNGDDQCLFQNAADITIVSGGPLFLRSTSLVNGILFPAAIPLSTTATTPLLPAPS